MVEGRGGTTVISVVSYRVKENNEASSHNNLIYKF